MSLFQAADAQYAMDETDEYAGEHEGEQTAESMAESKRRRIAKACDSCRRKKIKCSGENPCSNCSTYSTPCHFTDAPKKRAMPRSAKYIQGLEARLGKMEALVKQLLPDIELDDQGVDQAIRRAKPVLTPLHTSRQPTMSPELDQDLLDSAPTSLHRQASQEPEEELVEQMGHLWHDSDEEYEEAQYTGAASSYMPLVGVQGTVRDLTGDESFEQRINGFRKRIIAQERILGNNINALLDVSITKKIERFLAILPDPAICKLYIDAYFSILHAEFAFINQRQFLESLDPVTWRPKVLQDIPFLSLYLLVMCFGSHLSRQDVFYTEDQDEGITYFTYARTLMFSVKEYGRFTFVQCAILNALYLERLGQMKELWIIGGVLVRSAQALGLHRRHSDPSMDEETKEVRKRCWWIIYDLDSRMTLLSGNPSAIHDADCDQELPTLTPEEIAENNDVRFKDGRQFSYSIAGIQLAQINHQIHRRLYSVQAIHHLSPEQVHKIVAEIDAQLLAFAENLPDEHKPGDGRDIEQQREAFTQRFQDFPTKHAACQRKVIRDCYLIPSLRLEYLQLVMLLHRRNTKPILSPTVASPTHGSRGGSHSPRGHQRAGSAFSSPSEFKLSERASRACSSHSIAVQTARTILSELCHRVPLMTTSGHILLSRFTSAASLMLFSSIVRNPSSSSARKDLELLQLTHAAFLEHHTRFPPSEEDKIPRHFGILTKIMPEILGELCKVSALAIQRAGSPRTKRSAEEDVGDLQSQMPSIFGEMQDMSIANPGVAFDPNYFGPLNGGVGTAATLSGPTLAPEYFPDSSGLFNFGWPVGFNMPGMQGSGAERKAPAGMAGLNLAAGLPALSPGYLFGLAASSGIDQGVLQQTPTGFLHQPAMLQQQQQQLYASDFQSHSMAGADVLKDDYDAQNFWNSFGMYHQQ
ncbi:fungal-specific transcription factor domain-domain-containing protein [Protomyces lactucae-debilis]|uniref:Fungal-specific transcription factor domain-domain-containing protein n=1 Tax=Protomyces lactucae-debilis TaxID=2754530 RepID=A0A1Y2FDT5_PROLT|nr:fungal-specific transcription factor domain-containing protein [Protomyces lactucae-debilis]ORY82079.1 fungal-specific transcription factor domain-domain-containing protein [Protomyces lactucae-debilis]